VTTLVAIADLHGDLPADLPEGEILVIAGDVCELADHSVDAQRDWLEARFYPWLDSLPHDEIVWIAGNHDFVCQEPGWRPGGRGHYLRDSGIELAGLSFYGIPWVPKLQMWAFYATDEELARRCEAIPPVDVLVSHGPPLGFGDALGRGRRAGSPALARRIVETPPRLCVFGHIHEDHGRWQHGPTTLANVAHVDERYALRPGAAQVFELA
jgi:Icc-related predicted phosphoesterase